MNQLLISSLLVRNALSKKRFKFENEPKNFSFSKPSVKNWNRYIA